MKKTLALARRLVGRPVAGDQREPLAARIKPVPAQAAPDAVRRDDDPAPTRAAELGGDPLRAEPGVTQCEGDDPRLDQHRKLVRHLRAPPLARAQHLQPSRSTCAVQVVGLAVNAEGTAGMADRGAPGQVEQLQPVAEEDVIMRHATQLLSLGGEGARVSRKSDSAPATAGALSRSKPYRSPNCREHSETVHP